MRLAALVVLVLALAPAAGASAPFRPAGFVPRVDNPWFPLRPGTVYTYRGVKDGKPSRDVVTVTRETRRIDGVRATTVRDRLFIEGRLEEKTTDWYAQDRAGNVWYLGEATEELDAKRHVTSREGSWLAGVDGAQPGISMPGSPVVGASGRRGPEPGASPSTRAEQAHVRRSTARWSCSLFIEERPSIPIPRASL